MKDLLQINNRKPTRQVNVGNISIGNGTPISIQTMTTTLTHDIDATLRQTERCVEAGAQIVRVAVPEERDAKALPELVKRSPVPIVADIHFNYRYALAAVDAGVAKVRINPGNIGVEKRIAQVLSAAKAAHIPIRIGVNEGSLEKDLLDKYPFTHSRSSCRKCDAPRQHLRRPRLYRHYHLRQVQRPTADD